MPGKRYGIQSNYSSKANKMTTKEQVINVGAEIALLVFFFFHSIFYAFMFNNVTRPHCDTAALCQIVQQIFQDFAIEYYWAFVYNN